MRYNHLNNAELKKFISFFNYDFYHIDIPLTAVVVEDTDITDTLTVPAKKDQYVSVLDISTCGWCYIKTEKQCGYIPCKFLQLQKEIKDIPRKYIMHFFSADKNGVFFESSDKRNEQFKFYNHTASFFRADIVKKSKVYKPPSKPKRKKKQLLGICQECGVTTSPEWRLGPNGAKSLCNACGLRWYKRQKALSACQNKEELTNNKTNKGTKTDVDSSIPYITKEEGAFLLKYSLGAAVKESAQEKMKSSTSDKLQEVDKEENNRTSIPFYKLSLAYICNK